MNQINRREFLKAGMYAGITVYLAPFMPKAQAALFEKQRLRPIAWDNKQGRPRFRVDGIAKVAGEKLFACDLRSRDISGWPREQSHALLLRATQADRLYQGFDLAIAEELKPQRVVTADDLARDGLTFPAFYGDDLLLPTGKTPAYLGQAVALLIWHDYAQYRLAKDALRATKNLIRYGKMTGPLTRDPWGSWRIVRVGGNTPYASDVYSSFKDGMVFPSSFRKQVPQWPVAQREGKLDAIGMYHAEQISKVFKPAQDKLVLEREYFSQSTDTNAFEPDNANGWYDASQRTLHLVVPTQSPHEVAEAAAEMMAKSHLPVEHIVLHPCYTVGYGSKDHCAFPFYGVAAALYGEGRPVRLANDRFEQFQSALKRHSFRMRYRVAVDKKTGLFCALAGEFEGNGGGRANFSASVALVAATAAQSIYYLPKSDIASTALASRALDAGSARGYGTLQSMSATEMLVDEIAEKLGLDAIEFRQRNALKTGMKNTQGAIPGGALRIDEVLAKAKQHPLWMNRAKRKTDYELEHPEQRYGVGFACVQKDFGTGAEAAFAGVELSVEGFIRLRLHTVEIGTGMSTSQAVLCADWFGRPADEIQTAQTEWSDLPIETSGNPWIISQEEQDRMALNPRWSPSRTSPTSASNSAYFIAHATREAARLVFMQGLWPAALAIWGVGIGGGAAAPYTLRREDARWVEGKLSAAGMEPLALEQLAAKAHQLGLITGVIVHTFNRWQWAEADFAVLGETISLPIDGLALRYGIGCNAEQQSLMTTPGGYHVLDRHHVRFPSAQRNGAGVTYYSTAGILVELAINKKSGTVQLLSHHSILECGNQIVSELVSGQLQGGIAMGIGHALYEQLPLYEDGPGNGTWNLDRYHLPRSSEVAVWSQTGEVLPPLSATDPPKGMAEVTVIPVIAAIVNGIAHAIQHRFTELPVTADKIKQVLR